MFKVNPDPTFWMTVQVPVAGTAGVPLQVECRRWRRDQIAGLIDSYSGKSDDDLIVDVVAGWKDVDTPFSREALLELLQAYPGAGGAIARQFIAEQVEAKRKN